MILDDLDHESSYAATIGGGADRRYFGLHIQTPVPVSALAIMSWKMTIIKTWIQLKGQV